MDKDFLQTERIGMSASLALIAGGLVGSSMCILQTSTGMWVFILLAGAFGVACVTCFYLRRRGLLTILPPETVAILQSSPIRIFLRAESFNAAVLRLENDHMAHISRALTNSEMASLLRCFPRELRAALERPLLETAFPIRIRSLLLPQADAIVTTRRPRSDHLDRADAHAESEAVLTPLSAAEMHHYDGAGQSGHLEEFRDVPVIEVVGIEALGPGAGEVVASVVTAVDAVAAVTARAREPGDAAAPDALVAEPGGTAGAGAGAGLGAGGGGLGRLYVTFLRIAARRHADLLRGELPALVREAESTLLPSRPQVLAAAGMAAVALGLQLRSPRSRRMLMGGLRGAGLAAALATLAGAGGCALLGHLGPQSVIPGAGAEADPTGRLSQRPGLGGTGGLAALLTGRIQALTSLVQSAVGSPLQASLSALLGFLRVLRLAVVFHSLGRALRLTAAVAAAAKASLSAAFPGFR